jgi:hypothetical protein
LTLFTTVFLSTQSGCDQWNRKYGGPDSVRPIEPGKQTRFLREWQKRGSVPEDQLRLEKWMWDEYAAYHIPVLTPDDELPSVSQFDYSEREGGPRLRFHLNYRCSDNVNSRIGFMVSASEIIPLFDQIYLVEDLGPEFVQLKRVTDELPQTLRPDLNSRVFSLADADDPQLFTEYDVDNIEGKTEWDTVKILGFDEETGTVTLSLTPEASDERRFGPSTRKKLTLTVKQGELVEARGSAYRVVNIVPPQEFSGIGKIVGWVELAPVDTSESNAAVDAKKKHTKPVATE